MVASGTAAVVLAVAAAFGSTVVAANISFVSIGDWGGMALKDYHATDEAAVAKQFMATASELDAQYVINVGDNFYYYGVWNTSDPQWQQDFENVFTDKSMMVPWYSVLGNHDYGFNPEAQLQYKSPNNNRWVMPSRYYTKRLLVSGSQYITFIFLDSNPCVSDYRNNDPKNWDPCGSTYSHPADCQFHQNILKESCDDQYTWLKNTVATIDKDDWKVGVAHHVADEIDVDDLVGTLQTLGIDLYLNGHAHTLEYYQLDGAGAYVTTGAGCMVRLSSEESEDASAKAANGPRMAKSHEDMHARDKCKTPNGHTLTSIWTQKTAGFTTHTFSEDLSELTTNFVDYTGKTLYTFTVHKGVSPHPKPPSGGSCASYGCGTYDPSHSCQCNSYCSYHRDCCSDYKTVCG